MTEQERQTLFSEAEKYIAENFGKKRTFQKIPHIDPDRLFRNAVPGANHGIDLKELAEKIFCNRSDDFPNRLACYIAAKGKTNAEVYKKAGITPDCFSKILSGRTKKPGKDKVFAFSLVLELTIDEAADLLASAGYAFMPSNKTDLIIQYCIGKQMWDIDTVNAILLHFKQPVLCGIE